MRDLPLPTLPFSDMRPAETPRRSLPAGAPLDTHAARARLHVGWAETEEDVRQAQRLRHQVFACEMGARLTPPPGTPEGLDADRFDPFCEHLLVRSVDEEGLAGEVVGTYRVLTPEAARRAGGLYSETEFDLGRLAGLRPTMVELGRSCVHPDHRHGGAILALWGGLTEFMLRNQLDTMIGCASISMRDGGHYAASLWKQLQAQHLAGQEWQVQPRLPLPVDELRQDLVVEPPPLIRGYLRCGARILGSPAWDPDFNTADLPMLMRVTDLPSRYRRQFLGA